jgi:hypothetical protein
VNCRVAQSLSAAPAGTTLATKNRDESSGRKWDRPILFNNIADKNPAP